MFTEENDLHVIWKIGCCTHFRLRLRKKITNLDKSKKCRKQLDISQEQNFQDK